MAISAIAGLAATVGAAGAAGALASFGAFAAFMTTTAALTAFAIGAGLSILSRALMPKPDFGALMEGVTGTVREPTASRKIIYGKVRVGGAVVFIANSNQNKDLYLVICFACHEIEGYEAVYFNDEKVWENGSYVSDWASYANFAFYDGTQTTADSALSGASAFWGSTHVLNGIAYMRVKLTWDEDRKKFPQGVPNVSAVIKGKKLYDPRLDSTIGGSGSHRSGDSTTWEWSQNPALALYDYMTNTYYGLGESHLSMDYDAFGDAADVCDEAVTLDAGGTHDRYHANGVLDTGNAIKGNIEALTAAMGGRVGYVDGKYFAQAAKYYTPTITIDESMMVGAMSVQTKQSRRSMYNGVKGVFLSEEENYTLVDYPAKISSTYSTQDGDPIYLDMPLPFVTNNIRAQRLAKIALLKSRQQVVVNVPLNLAALKFKAGDFIAITSDRMDWSAKPFEVIGYDLQIGNDGAIIVNVQAIETDSDVYDWTASADEDPFNEPSDPTTNDGTTVAPVTSLSLTETTSIGTDGTIVPAILADWDAPADGFIDQYELQIQNVTTGNGFFAYTRNTDYLISPVNDSDNYQVSVIAVNTLGVRSTAVSATLTPAGDQTPPEICTGLVATGGFRSIQVEFTTPSDRDTSAINVYRSASLYGAYSIMGTFPVRPNAGYVYTNAQLGHGQTFYYKITALDNSDNESGFSSTVSAITDNLQASFTPRETRGYVYYLTSSASNPGTPSASYFDFSTGSFVGLTSGWSVDPPAQDGTDGTYWASRFQVVESTYSGTQAVQFSTPFQSFVFSGLVTFTSLNTELTTPGVGLVTTIDGGLINTGEIVIANGSGMSIRQGKFNPGLSGTGFWLGDNGSVPQFWLGTSTEYVYWDGSSLVARQLEIRDASNNVVFTSGGELDGTYIQDATVDTLQIDGNAVTVPLVGNMTDPTNINAGSSASVWVGPISWPTSEEKPTHILIQATVQFEGLSGAGATSRAVALEIYNNNSASFTGAALRGRVWGKENENLPVGLTVTGCLDMSTIGLSQYFAMRASIPSSSYDSVNPYKKVTVNSITVTAVKR